LATYKAISFTIGNEYRIIFIFLYYQSAFPIQTKTIQYRNTIHRRKRDILHFADFWGVLHFVEKITYYKGNTERNQRMLFSKNNWVFKRKKNVHPHCLSHHPPELPSFSLYTTFKVKL